MQSPLCAAAATAAAFAALQLLQIPYIYGGTREAERQRILGLFRLNTLVNTIGLSKVRSTSRLQCTSLCRLSKAISRQKAQLWAAAQLPAPFEDHGVCESILMNIIGLSKVNNIGTPQYTCPGRVSNVLSKLSMMWLKRKCNKPLCQCICGHLRHLIASRETTSDHCKHFAFACTGGRHVH
jgi:ERCC3/RAD25/XPB C-terminal helicase